MLVHALVDVLAPELSSNQIKPSQVKTQLAGKFSLTQG
jgi:hypothetical protein